MMAPQSGDHGEGFEIVADRYPSTFEYARDGIVLL
jgi:hypothetical protein